MTRTLQLPDVRRILDGLERRLSILERRLRESPAAPTDTEIIFSHPGGLAASWSPPAYVRDSSTLVKVVGALGNPGSTTTTVEVKKDATTVVTLTFGGGEFFVRESAAVPYTADVDQLIVAITAAGVGAEDLTVQCRFS